MADDLPDQERTIKVDILLGNDYYDEIIGSDKLKLDRGLYLINSSLGWMFSGRIPRGLSNDKDEQVMIVHESHDVAKAFWSLEGVGVQTEEIKDSEDMEAMNHFN